jgi:hypothetical protein
MLLWPLKFTHLLVRRLNALALTCGPARPDRQPFRRPVRGRFQRECQAVRFNASLGGAPLPVLARYRRNHHHLSRHSGSGGGSVVPLVEELLRLSTTARHQFRPNASLFLCARGWRGLAFSARACRPGPASLPGWAEGKRAPSTLPLPRLRPTTSATCGSSVERYLARAGQQKRFFRPPLVAHLLGAI